MPDDSTTEVLAAVLQVRRGEAATQLEVLLWQRARAPELGSWSLPGGRLGGDEDVETSARRQLAEKVDLREVAHLEQLRVFSDPARVPGRRTVAATFLGVVPFSADPGLPPDTAWHPVADLPPTSFDHGAIVGHARRRVAAKLSYTNLAFALAPPVFTLSALRDIYSATLGHHVDVTNMQRVLTRRRLITPTGGTEHPGRAGGRPATLYRFTTDELRVTDAFAVLRPPP